MRSRIALGVTVLFAGCSGSNFSSSGSRNQPGSAEVSSPTIKPEPEVVPPLKTDPPRPTASIYFLQNTNGFIGEGKAGSCMKDERAAEQYGALRRKQVEAYNAAMGAKAKVVSLVSYDVLVSTVVSICESSQSKIEKENPSTPICMKSPGNIGYVGVDFTTSDGIFCGKKMVGIQLTKSLMPKSIDFGSEIPSQIIISTTYRGSALAASDFLAMLKSRFVTKLPKISFIYPKSKKCLSSLSPAADDTIFSTPEGRFASVPTSPFEEIAAKTDGKTIDICTEIVTQLIQ